MANPQTGIYASEQWTDDEADVLRRYFTSLDGPVFALVNLPEMVKGALFARYSGSPKSLRRLFLDEFVGDLDITGDLGVDATVGLPRAEQLYERFFSEYGADAVSELGGLHLVCEQASNVLAKVLERGRHMSYMEKPTRHGAYEVRLPNGRYRYYRDPRILESPLGARYVGDMDRIFDAYAELLPVLQNHFVARLPKADHDSDIAWRQMVRFRAFDALRGMLPGGASTDLGIYGSGQAFEDLLVRLRAYPLPEAQAYAELILRELQKVIPSWVKAAADHPAEPALSAYVAERESVMAAIAQVVLGHGDPGGHAGTVQAPEVALSDWDPEGETKMVAAMLYPYTHLSDSSVRARVEAMSVEQRVEVIRRYAGDRADRRQRPGRPLERCDYRFDVVSDYGAFRDLQRHCPVGVESQEPTPAHGYTMPNSVAEAGGDEIYAAAMDRSAALYGALIQRFPADQAAYGLALAYRIRFAVQLSARDALGLIELPVTLEEGQAEFRQVAQQMYRLIRDRAGHRAVAAVMGFADRTDYVPSSLTRSEGERPTALRRGTQAPA